MAKKPTVQLPADWKGAFRQTTMRTTFNLQLSQPMIEFLCAVADRVEWDRMLYFQSGGIHRPDNHIAASRALEKRGLICIDPTYDHQQRTDTWEEACGRTNWQLTPAGEHIVALFKATGIFVEADAAIIKKAKRA